MASLRRLAEQLESLQVDRERDLGWSWSQIAVEVEVEVELKLPHPRTALAQGGHAADASGDCRTGVGPGRSGIFEAPGAAGDAGDRRRARAQVSYWMWTPLIARAITSRWISEVPSKIV